MTKFDEADKRTFSEIANSAANLLATEKNKIRELEIRLKKVEAENVLLAEKLYALQHKNAKHKTSQEGTQPFFTPPAPTTTTQSTQFRTPSKKSK